MVCRDKFLLCDAKYVLFFEHILGYYNVTIPLKLRKWGQKHPGAKNHQCRKCGHFDVRWEMMLGTCINF